MNLRFVFSSSLQTIDNSATLLFPVTVIGNEVNMKVKALDRAGRKATIIDVMKIRISHDNYDYASSYEIAKVLGLSPSDKLRKILNEMVSDGTLERIATEKSGRMKGWGYRLANPKENAPRKREIQIKSRGALVGQMELF